MKQTLQLKLSQHLALTPQLQLSIRLLQLSTLELNQEIEQFLHENPLLERDEPEEGAAPFVPAQEQAQLQAPAAAERDEPANFDEASEPSWGNDAPAITARATTTIPTTPTSRPRPPRCATISARSWR